MKFAPLSLTGLLLALFSFSLSAKDYYILFDENCMDRLTYVYETGEAADTSLVFHINLSQGEKVILETGTKGVNTLDYVPANFVSCTNPQLNAKLFETFYGSSDRFFIVLQESARKYGLYPVIQTSFFRLKEWVISYSGPSYQFQFNLLDGTIGENIARDNKSAEVYFEGRVENDCSGGFIFRQFSRAPGVFPHIDILLSPEIGVLEERMGKNVEDAFNRVKSLIQINGKTPDIFLKILCGKLPEETSPVESTPVITAYDSFTPKGSVEKVSPSPIQHTVSKGETLYSIAKKYNVGLGDINQWNNLNNNSLIYPGDKIIVSQPSVITPEFQGGFNLDPNQAAGGKIVEDDVIVFHSGTLQNKGGYDMSELADIHTVQAGETIASIAYKYGYAVWKFKEFNNLGEGDIIRIGQQLKTSHCVSYETAPSPGLTLKGDLPQPYELIDPALSGEKLIMPGVVGEKLVTPPNRNTPMFYDSTTPKGGITPGPTPYDSRPAGSRRFHIVLEGETLFGIARKYNMDVDQLRAINQLEKSEIVVPAQKIYLEP